jgi:hypothetical protein
MKDDIEKLVSGPLRQSESFIATYGRDECGGDGIKHRWLTVSGEFRPRSGRAFPSSLIQTLAIAEHLNFRHAANALGVSLSSISARVKALEEDLRNPPVRALCARCSAAPRTCSASFVGNAPPRSTVTFRPSARE